VAFAGFFTFVISLAGSIVGSFLYYEIVRRRFFASLGSGMFFALILWVTDFPSGWQGINTLDISNLIWALTLGIVAFFGSFAGLSKS